MMPNHSGVHQTHRALLAGLITSGIIPQCRRDGRNPLIMYLNWKRTVLSWIL